jgi:hypothetical protein
MARRRAYKSKKLMKKKWSPRGARLAACFSFGCGACFI